MKKILLILLFILLVLQVNAQQVGSVMWKYSPYLNPGYHALTPIALSGVISAQSPIVYDPGTGLISCPTCGTGGGGGTWGSITGTLSSQTDLQTALNGKQATGNYFINTDTTNKKLLSVYVFSQDTANNILKTVYQSWQDTVNKKLETYYHSASTYQPIGNYFINTDTTNKKLLSVYTFSQDTVNNILKTVYQSWQDTVNKKLETYYHSVQTYAPLASPIFSGTATAVTLNATTITGVTINIKNVGDGTLAALTNDGSQDLISNMGSAGYFEFQGTSASSYTPGIYIGTPSSGKYVYLASNPSGTRTLTLPDASGTVAVSATSPVTLSAAGAIGIQQATTSQSGYLSSTDWNTFNGKQAALGTGNLLPLNSGGTNANLTASNGILFTVSGAASAGTVSTTTANQILLSQISGGLWATPIFSTATYPATTTINQILYSSAANTIGGLATVNSAILTTSSGGVPTWFAPTAGSVLFGSTAGASQDNSNFFYDATNHQLISGGTADAGFTSTRAKIVTMGSTDVKLKILTTGIVATGYASVMLQASAVTNAPYMEFQLMPSATDKQTYVRYNYVGSATVADIFDIYGNGSVICGPQSALATSATDGYFYIRNCSGTPTGVPTSFTGHTAIEYDVTGHHLWIYDAGWVSH